MTALIKWNKEERSPKQEATYWHKLETNGFTGRILGDDEKGWTVFVQNETTCNPYRGPTLQAHGLKSFKDAVALAEFAITKQKEN